MKNIFAVITSLSYLFSSIILFGMALMIMGWSLYEVVIHFNRANLIQGEFISVMLQAVGTIVIAVAIIDVAKYMIEEEVFRKHNKELRSAVEARQTMTKIIVIITIAVGIEGLVYIFKAGTEDLTLLLYPAFLLLVSAFLIVGLGIYQKLSIDVEHNELSKIIKNDSNPDNS